MQGYKDLLRVLGFQPKENAVDVYAKTYPNHQYVIEVDFQKQKINYGPLIKSESKTTQNFSQAENWVVLECVDRLLTKGYKPNCLILEKTWPAGHGTSGRLDICVTREKDGSEYLLIECKTYGKEFDKAVAKMNKDGDQLFTYFKFSNKADVIMLYTSALQGKKVVYKNEIVKIEDDYRTGDVKDFYEKWNKLTKDNGVFETWVSPYCFESKALVKGQLKPINQEDSSFIFNRFLEILRHNVVSDKGNAFNKKTSKEDNDELDFQWKEGVDDHVTFQLRLTDLYKKGMQVFLSRTVSDFDESEFDNKYKHLSQETKAELLKEINTLRLEKNNEFAIKEVYDHDSFVENAKIVKEVVELLQGYKIRYNKRQQYLSDFFELLLTTGLKQEAGQFFTPVPVAQFIIKSLPLEDMIDQTLSSKTGDLLPYMIDYAAGSGHFITEYMHEVQDIINKKSPTRYIERTKKQLNYWQSANYEWATDYVYGIEKDYRLVKVGKVGCYLHGDGLANVILSDGLGNFVNTKDYKGKLRKKQDDKQQDNQQFDILLSNPPYSVSAFRQTTRDYYTEQDFGLYQYLTDNSSEIECLFVERMKQLLKDGGMAGIILPSSILTNGGIYTKTRELLLKYFEFVAITELGSNTFMATGTNTVVLFLRRRNNYESVNLQKSVDKFFSTHTDGSINGIEHPVGLYVSRVWEGLTFDDYLTLLDKNPNENVRKHDLYREYTQKLTAKKESDFWNKVLSLEREKLFYFILAYPQKLVVVRTGEKEAEKRFLGYEFSHARGREGIHAIQRGKTIEECTRLFDAHVDNPQKASTYIYKAFKGDLSSPIDESLKENISRIDLLDMMTFDRADFEKTINTNARKRLSITTKWDIAHIGEVADVEYGTRIVRRANTGTAYPVFGGGNETFRTNSFNRTSRYVVSRFGMSPYCVRFVEGKFYLNDSGFTVLSRNESALLSAYLDLYLYLNQGMVYACGRGVGQKNIDMETFKAIPIPLPPLDVQQKIVDEIEKIEQKDSAIKQEIDALYQEIARISKVDAVNKKLEEFAILLKRGKSPKYATTETSIKILKSGQVRGLHSFDLTKTYYASADMKLDERLLQANDLLINSTGVGTAGRVNIFNLSGNFTVDSHITILRLDVTKLLPLYALYQLYYNIGFKNIEKMATGQSGQIELSLSTIANIKIPVPSLKDQQRIVKEIEKLEQQIAKAQSSITQSEQQKQAILDKYLK